MGLRLTLPEIELRRHDLTALLPGALCAVAGLILFHLVELPEKVRGFFDYYPFLVLSAGLFLGWRFDRTRLIFALAFLASASLFLTRTPTEPAAYAAVAVLLPLNLAMISFFSERGLFTRPGLLRFAVIFGQFGLLRLFAGFNPAGYAAFFSGRIVPVAAFERLPLGQMPVAALLFGGGLLLLRFLRRPTAIDASFLWALIVVIVPLAARLAPEMLTLWFATAGLILTLSLIETSHRMAYRDELTGLPSRRALNEALQRAGRTYAIAMVDVDHFKKVNDTYGHDVGDQVLKMVAGRIDAVTGGGRPYRFGGEEFTVYFPNRTAREALPHLEDLRFAIEKGGFTLRGPERPKEKPDAAGGAGGGQRLKVTVSIGVAERNQFNHTPAQVIKAADKALYRAKDGGRNQVVKAGAARSGE